MSNERACSPGSDEDEAGAAWAEGIAREWNAELNDPREDIYTMEDGVNAMVAILGHFDGKVIVPDEPVDLPRNTRVRIYVEPAAATGTPGSASLQFAGTIDAESLREMSAAIEEGCERVDPEW